MDVAELADAFKGQGAQAGMNHTQLMQRVQELMGQGTDVSSLFATIISSASTRDITVKKAAYAFLSKYGHANEELCFLGINTLHQDCTDLDPIVRSLAIRTLCSLGQRSVLRFMLQPLNTGFQDKNAHVRKTAAMACISLYELDHMFVLESEIVDKLYGLIRDRDTQVIISAILALERILVDEGGIVINQALAAHLIQRYKDWTPAQLQLVLNVLCRYKPQTEDEIYEIMNNIDDGLRHPSLGIQMATLRLFIWLCQDLNEIQEDVQITIEETLIRHLDSSDPDLMYASLKHLALLIDVTGGLRHSNSPQHIQSIYCRPGDPVVTKLEKLKLCTTIALSANDSACGLILDHLSQVASMKDALQRRKSSRSKLFKDWLATHVDVACCAIGSIGMIGSHRPNHSDSDHHKTQPRMDRNTSMISLDRLFKLLVLFSDLDLLSEERSVSKNRESSQEPGSSESWIHNSLSELELEEDQVARLLTTLLLAIEGCWQFRWDSKPCADDRSGVLDAFQIKALGLLLLRHLDQDELDRLAKKKKPLRFQYDHDNSSASSNLDKSLQHTSEEHQTGAVSRLARVGGIRILLLEESCQQLVLRKQLQSVDSNPLPLIIDSPPVGSAEKEKKLTAIKSALEMRSQYAHLLQQQVQDLVQSIDQCSKLITPTAAISDSTFLRIKAEQIAVLNLACHLVALSIEHEDTLHLDNNTLFHQRLDILAQAVDQLIPCEPEQPSNYQGGHDLLSLEMEPSSQGVRPRETTKPAEYHVSMDVADRARMIETLFLTPYLSSNNSASSDPAAAHPPRPESRGNFLSAPHFQSENYKQIVQQKLVNLFGVSSAAGQASPERADNTVRDKENNIAQQAYQEWTFQIGFNTMAVAR